VPLALIPGFYPVVTLDFVCDYACKMAVLALHAKRALGIHDGMIANSVF
jgi:hypothetical protein